MPIQVVKFSPDALPEPTKRINERKYPFSKSLEVGEGFWVPNKEEQAEAEDASTLQNMQTHCSNHGRKDGAKYECRIHPDNTAWLQVWRSA